MNYESMSDFEINKLVAEARGGFGGSTNNEYAPNEVVCFDEKPFHTERDYCGNPADAWPIIVENEITIYPPRQIVSKLWGAQHFVINHPKVVTDKNPLRAACIVYLMMQEGE